MANLGGGAGHNFGVIRRGVIAKLAFIGRGQYVILKGVARGSWGARDPPFCKPLLTKQPKTGGENAMTISWP